VLTVLLGALAALIAIAAVPERTGGLDAHARPLADYGAALAWVDSVQRAERAVVDVVCGGLAAEPVRA
jgi:hypothetical protein